MTDLADDLAGFIDRSPTPFHAVHEASQLLVEAGFTEVSMVDQWPAGGRQFLAVDGMLVAWVAPDGDPRRPLRIIGAHSDSPNLRLKPQPQRSRAGIEQLLVEPYGGLLLNSWVGRELGLAGRLVLRQPAGSLASTLVLDRRPLLHLPQLAIHLDRDVNHQGLVLNPAQHLHPVWGFTESSPSFGSWLGEIAGPQNTVVGADLMLFDVEGPRRVGPNGEFLSAARLDNLCSVFGAVTALVRATQGSAAGALDAIPCIAVFDHEEVGSTSARGAASALFADIVDRMLKARGASSVDGAVARSQSRLLSADMAHGSHPNYLDRHDPDHPIRLGGGPVIKTNVNQRYATEGQTAAEFRSACAGAGVAVQEYSHRNDLPCGSTIGPQLSANLGIPAVDVGMAQWAMHSIRETMAASDVAAMVSAFTAWLRFT